MSSTDEQNSNADQKQEHRAGEDVKHQEQQSTLDDPENSPGFAVESASNSTPSVAALNLPQSNSAIETDGNPLNGNESRWAGAEYAIPDRTGSGTPSPPPPKDDELQRAIDHPPVAPSAEDMDSTTAWNESTRVWNGNEEQDHDVYTAPSQLPERDFDDKPRNEAETAEESRPEIQNILDQFGDGQGGQPESPVSSPTKTELPIFQYPPRVSSLEHIASSSSEFPGESSKSSQDPEKASLAPSYTPSVTSQPPLPEPDPEPDLAFDFHRFLEQLRHRTADPVAKFLRSFLQEFGKKQWQVHEQVKIISDFLTFISGKMGQCEVWRSVSDAEFDNAREGMEKLVMNRLYVQTFSPEIPPVDAKSLKGRRSGSTTPLGPGRKGQHQEDVERDEVLAQKVRIYGWIREEHLDIKPFGDKGRRFLSLAQKELSKIKSYRAPRDKVICVLNCCKVLFGFLRNAQSDQSADAFIPLLIFTVLKANPEHLVSNVQYILRFRNQDKLGGEAGYYMSSLMGAVQFIENLDRTNLTISDEEFEKNVEAAVSSIAERHQQDERRPPSNSHPRFNEKSAPSRAEVTPRHSLEGEQSNPRRAASRQAEANSGDESDENAAVAGLLRTIQKPLSTIGRIFSEESPSGQAGAGNRPPSTPQPGVYPPRTTSVPSNGAFPPGAVPMGAPPLNPAPGATAEAQARARVEADVAAARQASAETAQAHQVMVAEHQTVVETLSGMFPALDKDVISDVVRMKEGQIGQAVDACLAMSR